MLEFMSNVVSLNEEQGEQLQQDIITHCDGLPDELITALCKVVVEFTNTKGR